MKVSKFLMFVVGLLMSVQLFAVDLNKATVEELSSLKGIGAATAQKIVDYRTKHKFQRSDEIMNIKGIGQKKYDAIKNDLSV